MSIVSVDTALEIAGATFINDEAKQLQINQNTFNGVQYDSLDEAKNNQDKLMKEILPELLEANKESICKSLTVQLHDELKLSRDQQAKIMRSDLRQHAKEKRLMSCLGSNINNINQETTRNGLPTIWEICH